MNGSACRPALTLVIILCALLHPAPSGAAELGVNSTTLFRFEQRAVPGFSGQTAVPATEFIGADLEKLGDGNLSMHLYGWGRADLAERSGGKWASDADLAHAFMKYRLARANGEMRAGRIFVREGAAVERIDGVSAKADLRGGLSLALFGGAPARLDRDNGGKGDFIAGGRGSCRLGGILEMGLSGLHEGGITPDPASGARSERQLVGGDVWLLPVPGFELNGHSFYNAASDGLAEHSYLATIRPGGSMILSGSYNEVRFRNLFNSTTIRSLFNPDDSGGQKSYGAAITWRVPGPLELTADYRRLNRFSAADNATAGNSHRYGAELRAALLYKQLRSGLSYHRSDGASGLNSYHQARWYGLYDAERHVASLDAVAQIFDNTVFNRKEAFEVIASLGYRILAELALSGEIVYARNPRLDDEVRGVLRLNYSYTYASKGASK